MMLRKHHHREEEVGEAVLSHLQKEAEAAVVELLLPLVQEEEVVGAGQQQTWLHRLCLEGAGVEEEQMVQFRVWLGEVVVVKQKLLQQVLQGAAAGQLAHYLVAVSVRVVVEVVYVPMLDLLKELAAGSSSLSELAVQVVSRRRLRLMQVRLSVRQSL